MAELSVSLIPVFSPHPAASKGSTSPYGRGRRIPPRADAAVLFTDQFFLGELLGFAVTPLLADAFVEVLGEGLGQTVGERFGHNRVVVVLVRLEFPAEVIDAETGRNSEGA